MSNSDCAGRTLKPVLLALALCIGTSYAAQAADDCLTQPNLRTSATGHWYYRIDRATQRRCWYLKQADTTTPATVAPAATTATTAPPTTNGQPNIFSALSSMFGAAPRPNSMAPEATTAAGATETAPDVPAKRQAPKALRVNSAKTVPSKPPRQSPSQSLEKSQEPEKASPEAADSEALFREFLIWRQRQNLSP